MGTGEGHSLAPWLRRAHRVLALIVGVQALLWMASGLYMTAISIDVIHGDHLAHTTHESLDLRTPVASPKQLGIADDARVKLKRWQGREVYEVGEGAATRLVDARSGVRLTPLDRRAARQVAQSLYRGKGAVEAVNWLTRVPAEAGGRPAPLWQVRFGDAVSTTLYISPFTGERLATRHTWWRAFDLLWMLHIMDYDTREDINNPLLRIAAVFGLALALVGLVLAVRMLRRTA